MDNPSFQAYRLHAGTDGAPPEGRFETLSADALSAGDTLIKVAYAGLNYKDALAQAGRGNIIRQYPRIGGIDLSGIVVHSADPALAPGQEVVVHGFGIGVDCDGGYAEYARVPHEWVLPLPAGISLRDAAVLGAAGYTAALSLHWMEHCGLTPDQGEVLVTGATGGVAGVAIDILSQRGYRVCAMSGKPDAAAYLPLAGVDLLLGTEDHSGLRVEDVRADLGGPDPDALWGAAPEVLTSSAANLSVSQLLTQVGADRAVLADEFGVDDAPLPAEPEPVLAIFAVALDCEDGVDAVRLAEREVVLAMVGRHVDKTRARVGGHEIARKERARLGEESAKGVHRMTGDGSGEL
mgnify:CR=1 FL=1